MKLPRTTPALPPVPPEADDFPVKIATVIGGDVVGYTFVERWLDPTTLLLADKGGGRDNSTADPAYAVDGSSYKPGDYARCRRGPGTGGRFWELWGKRPGADSGGSDCSSCAWLNDVDPSACWTLYRRGGTGRCACFGVDDPTDPAAGVKLLPDGGEWFAEAMVQLCCGCGTAALNVGAGTATLTLAGVHVSCVDPGSGGSPATFDLTLTADCCGVLPDGRRFVQFTGWGPDACDGDQAACDNTFRFIAVCGTTCPDTTCDCPPCGTCCSGPASKVLKSSITGFTDNHWNGAWAWAYTSNCTWVATCGAYTSTMTYVPDATPNPVWRLTHGGSVYEMTGFGCCSGGNVFERVSGSDGPSSITIDASADCGTCTPDWPATLTVTITDLSMTGVGACFPWGIGDTITLHQEPGFDPANPAWINQDFLTNFVCCNDGTTLNGNVRFACVDTTKGCQGFSLSFTQGDGPSLTTPTEPCSCNPFFWAGTGSKTRSSTCGSALGGTISVTAEVSA